MYAQPFGSGGEDKFSGHKDDQESSMLHLQVAFSALIEEVWVTSVLYPKRFPIGKKPKRRFYGYGLMRPVH